jgi:O-acetyl-ADP-ribose deacetylase (regulator of RNase III)
MKINTVLGDISRVKADGLITAINSGHAWFGGIDGVIQRVAGDMFHSQAAAHGSLKQGVTVVAKKKAGTGILFEHVVFVVDDLEAKLREVVKAGLDAASTAGLKTVTLPTIRMGVMLGAVEKSRTEALQEMVEGIRLHQEAGSTIETITFVIYNDQETLDELKGMLAGIVV